MPTTAAAQATMRSTTVAPAAMEVGGAAVPSGSDSGLDLAEMPSGSSRGLDLIRSPPTPCNPILCHAIRFHPTSPYPYPYHNHTIPSLL